VGGNAAFPLVMGVLRDAIAGHLLDALDAMDDARPVLSRLAAEHGAIVDAIDAGDGPLAAKLGRAHVWDFDTRDVATAGRDGQDDADADG
jgi:GntR family transcriptional repressor for pyruvate dehydrogenase complex